MSDHLRNSLLIILVAFVALVVGVYVGETGGLNYFSEPETAVTCPVVQKDETVCPVCDVMDDKMDDKKEVAPLSADCKTLVKDKLVQVGFMPETVTSLNGVTVKTVSGKDVEVEFNAVLLDPLSEGKLTRTFTVPSGVKIKEHVPRNSDEALKESEEFQKAMEALNERRAKGEDVAEEIAALEPPVPFDVKDVSLSDLKPGDQITVESEKDIRASDHFEASAVQLLSRAQPTSEAAESPSN